MNLARFDFTDIFKANRLAFSVQRIWIQVTGLTVGYFIYVVFSYLSIVAGGTSFSSAWDQSKLLPCLALFNSNLFSWILFGIGIVVLGITYLVSATAIARASYMILKGNPFYTWREAYTFAFRKILSVVFIPISIAIFIGLMLVGGIIIGLLGKIPVVGELGISLFYLLWIFAGVFVFYFGITLIIALISAPSVIATTDDDAFEGVFQAFSIIWNQPIRFIIYQLIVIVLSIAGLVIFSVIMKQGFLISDAVFLSFIGEKYREISAQGLYLLSDWITVLSAWIEQLFGDFSSLFYFDRTFIQQELSGVSNVASWFIAISFVAMGAIVVSYGFAIFNVGNTIIFLILKKKKDNTNLLERHDAEEDYEDDEVFEELNGSSEDSSSNEQNEQSNTSDEN